MSPSELFLNRLKAGSFTRVVAFGSSNTERRIAGMHWFDCFELSCRSTCGPITSFINSGRGGDSTIDLLNRIERDCLNHQPHLAFITVGGNDSNPKKNISLAIYRDNLHQIVSRLQAQGALPVLQTYYAMDLPKMDPEHATAFLEMMEIVREVARETGCMLIDHLVRWEALRLRYNDRFLQLLGDPMHVNALGNLVLGLDITRAFNLRLPDDACFREAELTQSLLDLLVETGNSPCR